METNHKYKIGFALSGGFIKGFAHLGVMQALFEYRIKPDIISGVSAGALAGTFIADGKEPYEVLELFDHIKFSDFTKFTIPKAGFFKMDEVINFINEHISVHHIEKLAIPLIITATDIEHGKSVHFKHGDIATHVAASCCMPVLFEPLNINGTDYMDGGIFMNLPVSPIRKDCQTIIAVNVSPLNKEGYKRHIMTIMLRAYSFLNKAETFKEQELSDILIEIENLWEYNNRDLEKSSEIFQHGYNKAMTLLKDKDISKIFI